MTKEMKVGIFFVIALVILGIIVELLGEVPFIKSKHTFYTYFLSVGELLEGNPIKLEGLEVGKVSNIEVGDGKILVELSVNKSAPIKKDSIATIKLTSLLGISYVNLSFGDPKTDLAEDGDVLQSTEQADINVLLSKLESTVSSFQSAFGDDENRIGNILENLDTLLSDATRGKGTLGRLLSDEQLYIEMKDTFANLNDITTSLKAGKGTLGKLISDDSLYEETKSSLIKMGALAEKLSESGGTMGKLMSDETLYDQATEAVTNLNQILKKINSGEGTIGKLVSDDELYYNALNATKKLEKAIDTQEDLAPLQTIGTALGIITVF